MSSLRWFILFLAFQVMNTDVVHTRNVLPYKCISYSQPGDIILGGVFPLRFDSRPVPCRGQLSPWGVRLSEAMIFSVDEINRRYDLLPNVTLGFDLRDDCRSEEVAIWTTLSLIHNTSSSFPEQPYCAAETLGPVTGIVGSGFSETSIFLAKTASLFQVPVVSYAASSDELSDKSSYPYFLRTYPPDSLQVKAILDVIIYFKWTYVGLIYSLESDGIRGAFALQEEAEELGVCVAFLCPVREFPTPSELGAITEKLKNHTKVNVVVLFGAKNEAQSVLGAVRESVARRILWIGTTHWGYLLAQAGLEQTAVGSLFIRDFRPKVQAFGEYFTALEPTSQGVSPWFRELAMERMAAHNCSDLSLCPLYRGNTEGLVINSVYAFAHAIDTLLRQNCSGDLCQRNDRLHIDGALLLHALKNVEFEGSYGLVSFDSNGDGRGKYAISHLQHSDGEYKLVDVGWWDAVKETPLSLSDDMIKWPEGNTEPPMSVCRERCLPGYAVVTLRQRCCLGCKQCPPSSIVVNDTSCSPCESTYWPDEDFETCVRIVPSKVPLNEPLVVSILTMVVVGLFCCVLTGLGLIIKRRHKLVKATSRELISIHFTGLVLSYVAALVLLTAAPTATTCVILEINISISFTMTYAPTLLKVIRIHRIFKSGRVTTRRPCFTSPKSQFVAVVTIVLVQVCTSILSTVLGPSTPVTLYTLDMGNRSEILCRFGHGFIASCSLNLAIIIGCCYFAFRARRVPDNYNESKLIAVSVYTTLLLCLVAAPVYTTTVKALPKVATISLAITLNAYLSLVCMYFSKLCAVACENKVNPARLRAADQQEMRAPGPSSMSKPTVVSTSLAAPISRPCPLAISAWGNEIAIPHYTGKSGTNNTF